MMHLESLLWEGQLKNEAYADYSGIGFRHSESEVPDEYKASTLFVDMAPYRPTLVRGKEKYGTSVEQNEIMQNVADYNKFCSSHYGQPPSGRIENPELLNGVLWEKAKKASMDAFGKVKYGFVQYLYDKWGGR